MRLTGAASLLAVGVAILCGCGAAPAGATLKAAASAAGAHRAERSHVILIMLENRELDEVIGSSSAPYINRLARRYLLATDYHATTHPSLPNYISLIAGSTLGISSDCTECEAHGETLVQQLERAHESWGAFMEGMPSPCYTGEASGQYVKRHDPFVYFPEIINNPARCRNIVPITQFARDVRAGSLPSFSWITPNLCNDGHNCANSEVDHYLSGAVPYILRVLGPHGLLIITWDEGATNSSCCSAAAGGIVPLIMAGPDVRAHRRFKGAADHYSLLALIERIFGLPRLREAACSCTPSLNGAFKHDRPPLLNRR